MRDGPHYKLTNGVGKCSVPMWSGGCPDGFCDKPAYGDYIPGQMFRDAWTGETRRMDGKYSGFVPGLACPAHGGPEKPNHHTKCNRCGDHFDMRDLSEVIQHERCLQSEPGQ